MARTFGERSSGNLAGVHPLLVEIATEALQNSASDFTVICGHRDKAGQDAALRAKTTKVAYPNSAHNQLDPATGKPRSCAIDVIPYPFTGWEDKAMFAAWKQIADAMFAAAAKRKVKLRWGGDFNRDGDKTTKDSWDSPHFELHPWREYASKK
jgi:peptidoglycan LD-endopeptidase CwlK